MARARLGVPDEVRSVADAYREEIDVHGGFLDELCVPGGSATITAEELYAGVLQFDGGLVRETAEREAERLLRVEHARAFVTRQALAVAQGVAVAARPGCGPQR